MTDRPDTTEIAAPRDTTLVRQGFGETTAMTGVEMQAQALAAQVKAAVEARYILAMRRPRNLDAVRTKLMGECRRPRFAEEARYAVPRGREQDAQGKWIDKMVEGPSIRFAEAAIRCMTNIDTTAMTVYDDATSRQVRVTAIDLESNVTYSKDITITKTMERKKLRQNQVAIGERYNAAGERVYIVEIPDSELQNVQAAHESKVLRTLVLRLVPGDITEECMDTCVNVIKDQHAKDPREALKKICDGFAQRGVHADELVTYLGKPLDQMTAAEYQHLRSLWSALRDGQINWSEALERKLEGRPAVTEAAKPKTEAPVGTQPPPDGINGGPGIEPGTIDIPATPPAATPPKAAAPKGAKAVAAQVKADKESKAKEAAKPPPTPGPGSPEWEAAKARAKPPAPPEPDPHGDPPPPDDVELPKDDQPPHPAGDRPDWMA